MINSSDEIVDPAVEESASGLCDISQDCSVSSLSARLLAALVAAIMSSALLFLPTSALENRPVLTSNTSIRFTKETPPEPKLPEKTVVEKQPADISKQKEVDKFARVINRGRDRNVPDIQYEHTKQLRGDVDKKAKPFDGNPEFCQKPDSQYDHTENTKKISNGVESKPIKAPVTSTTGESSAEYTHYPMLGQQSPGSNAIDPSAYSRVHPEHGGFVHSTNPGTTEGGAVTIQHTHSLEDFINYCSELAQPALRIYVQDIFLSGVLDSSTRERVQDWLRIEDESSFGEKQLSYLHDSRWLGISVDSVRAIHFDRNDFLKVHGVVDSPDAFCKLIGSFIEDMKDVIESAN